MLAQNQKLRYSFKRGIMYSFWSQFCFISSSVTLKFCSLEPLLITWPLHDRWNFGTKVGYSTKTVHWLFFSTSLLGDYIWVSTQKILRGAMQMYNAELQWTEMFWNVKKLFSLTFACIFEFVFFPQPTGILQTSFDVFDRYFDERQSVLFLPIVREDFCRYFNCASVVKDGSHRKYWSTGSAVHEFSVTWNKTALRERAGLLLRILDRGMPRRLLNPNPI